MMASAAYTWIDLPPWRGGSLGHIAEGVGYVIRRAHYHAQNVDILFVEFGGAGSSTAPICVVFAVTHVGEHLDAVVAYEYGTPAARAEIVAATDAARIAGDAALVRQLDHDLGVRTILATALRLLVTRPEFVDEVQSLLVRAQQLVEAAREEATANGVFETKSKLREFLGIEPPRRYPQAHLTCDCTCRDRR